MHYFLIIGAFLWFAFLAPPLVTVATTGAFALVTIIGTRTVQLVTGAPAGMGEVLRSVGLAFLFAGIALFGMSSMLGSVNVVLLLVAVLSAYVLGFSIGLDVGFGPACIIAAITTGVSGILYFLLKSLF